MKRPWWTPHNAPAFPHIVKHSNLGADEAAASRLQRWHRDVEKHIQACGLGRTFVRPTGFMSNALAWAATIPSSATVYGTGGQARIAVVDPRDIAAVAVVALTQPGHQGAIYDVTGPQALTNADQVAIIAEMIGTPIRYVDLPEQAARTAMIGRRPAGIHGRRRNRRSHHRHRADPHRPTRTHLRSLGQRPCHSLPHPPARQR